MDGFIKRKLKQIFGKYFQAYAHQLLHPLTAHLANPFLVSVDHFITQLIVDWLFSFSCCWMNAKQPTLPQRLNRDCSSPLK